WGAGSGEGMTMGEAFWAHETACVDDPGAIGEGTRVWHFSHIAKGASLGPRCSIGQNVFIAPGAVVGAGVKIQNNVSVYDGVKLKVSGTGKRRRAACESCGTEYRSGPTGLVEKETPPSGRV